MCTKQIIKAKETERKTKETTALPYSSPADYKRGRGTKRCFFLTATELRGHHPSLIFPLPALPFRRITQCVLHYRRWDQPSLIRSAEEA